MSHPPLNHPSPRTASPPPWRALPAGIWLLGCVSMLMDASSELIHSLLPLFMVSVLGASMTTVGLVEGVAEATAAFAKVFSGAISDYFGKRKFFVVLGYGLAAVTKPLFPLAHSIAWVFAGRFIDRIGKGIRGAPRDALVADIAPQALRGAAYGLRQALDAVGAVIGPVLAVAFMAALADDLRAVLWIAVLPAFLSVALLITAVHEPARHRPDGTPRPPLALADARRLPRRYWLVVLLGSVFTLARFSEAFLVLRAQDTGMGFGDAPLVMVAMSGVYALTAYPAGVAADRFNRRSLLLLGLTVLIVSDLVLAVAATPAPVLIGAALWGLHMGLTQGLLAKLVADTAPIDLRGTAFGLFNLASGGALLLASVIAGALWAALGAAAPFLAGAAFAATAAGGLLLWRAKPATTGA